MNEDDERNWRKSFRCSVDFDTAVPPSRPVRSCDRWGNSARRDPRDKNTFVVNRPRQDRRDVRRKRSANARISNSDLMSSSRKRRATDSRCIVPCFDRSRHRLIILRERRERDRERARHDHASSRIHFSSRVLGCQGRFSLSLSLSLCVAFLAAALLVTLFASARSLQGWNDHLIFFNSDLSNLTRLTRLEEK